MTTTNMFDIDILLCHVYDKKLIIVNFQMTLINIATSVLTEISESLYGTADI